MLFWALLQSTSLLRTLKLRISRARRRRVPLRALALVLVLALGFEECAQAAPAVLAAAALRPAPLPDYGLPASVATVDDAFRSTDPDAPKILLVRDAHANPSGQFNLARTLDAVLERENISVVYTEGADRDVSLLYLRDLADPSALARVAREYVHRGGIKGSEYLELTGSRRFTIRGVEEERLYGKALDVYRGVSAARSDVGRFLAELRVTAEFVEDKTLPADLIAALRLRRALREKRIGWSEYLDRMVALSLKLGLTLSNLPDLEALRALRAREQELDAEAAGREWDSALARGVDPEKGSEEFPHLRRYAAYKKILSNTRFRRLTADQEALEQAVYGALAGSADELQSVRIALAIETLGAIAAMEATPDQIRRYRSDAEAHDPVRIAAWLNRRLMQLGTGHERALFMDEASTRILRQAAGFYLTADARDRVFVRRTLRRMQRDGLRTSVLITGGYHTDHLKALLRHQNISYAVITPQVIHETDKRGYERLLLGSDRSTLIPRYHDSLPAAARLPLIRSLGLDPAGVDAARLAQSSADRTPPIGTVREGLNGLMLAVNILDLGIEYRSNQPLVNRNGLKKLKELIPTLADMGIREIYVYGLAETSVLSKHIHQVPTTAQYFFHEGSASVTVAHYPTRSEKLGEVTLRDSWGNIFSINDMRRINPILSEGDAEQDLLDVTAAAQAAGITVVADMISWLSPGAINSSNYRQMFYREIPAADNERFRQVSDAEKNAWIERNILSKDLRGSFAVRVTEGGVERIVLVKHLAFHGSHSADQAIPNPLHPATLQYYLDSVKKQIDRGMSGLRVDLGHLLLKRNIRGYFDEIRHNAEASGSTMEEWLRNSGMDIRPGENYEAWWSRQPEPWRQIVDEASYYALEKNRSIHFYLETYNPVEQHELFNLGVDGAYLGKMFEANYRVAGGGSPRAFDDAVNAALYTRPRSLIYMTNFDQISEEAMGGSGRAAGMLLAILAHVGSPAIVDLRDFMFHRGHVAKIVGGTPDAKDPHTHPFPTHEQLLRRKDFEGIKAEIRKSPWRTILRDFLNAVPGDGEKYVTILNNSNRERYFTIGWRAQNDRWAIAVLDFKPQYGRDPGVTVQLPKSDDQTGFDVLNYRPVELSGAECRISRWEPGHPGSPAVVEVRFKPEDEIKPYRFITLTPIHPVAAPRRDAKPSLENALRQNYIKGRVLELTHIVRDAEFKSIRQSAVFFSLLDDDYFVRAFAGNLLAGRARQGWVEADPTKLLAHLRDPLKPLKELRTPRIPGRQDFDPIRARRNSRYVMLWVLARILQPDAEAVAATMGRDLKPYQERVRRVLDLQLRREAESWGPGHEARLRALVDKHDADLVLGARPVLPPLEVMRLVMLRAQKVEGSLPAGQRDNFYWVKLAVERAYPQREDDPVSDILYASTADPGSSGARLADDLKERVERIFMARLNRESAIRAAWIRAVLSLNPAVLWFVGGVSVTTMQDYRVVGASIWAVVYGIYRASLNRIIEDPVFHARYLVSHPTGGQDLLPEVVKILDGARLSALDNFESFYQKLRALPQDATAEQLTDAMDKAARWTRGLDGISLTDDQQRWMFLKAKFLALQAQLIWEAADLSSGGSDKADRLDRAAEMFRSAAEQLEKHRNPLYARLLNGYQAAASLESFVAGYQEELKRLDAVAVTPEALSRRRLFNDFESKGRWQREMIEEAVWGGIPFVSDQLIVRDRIARRLHTAFETHHALKAEWIPKARAAVGLPPSGPDRIVDLLGGRPVSRSISREMEGADLVFSYFRSMMRKELVSKDIRDMKRVLIIGASRREVIDWINATPDTTRITAVNIDGRMLEEIERHFVEHQPDALNRIEMFRADATQLDPAYFPDETYDFIYEWSVDRSAFREQSVADRVLPAIHREETRVLKKGGYLYKLVTDDDLWDFDNQLDRIGGHLFMKPAAGARLADRSSVFELNSRDTGEIKGSFKWIQKADRAQGIMEDHLVFLWANEPSGPPARSAVYDIFVIPVREIARWKSMDGIRGSYQGWANLYFDADKRLVRNREDAVWGGWVTKRSRLHRYPWINEFLVRRLTVLAGRQLSPNASGMDDEIDGLDAWLALTPEESQIPMRLDRQVQQERTVAAIEALESDERQLESYPRAKAEAIFRELLRQVIHSGSYAGPAHGIPAADVQKISENLNAGASIQSFSEDLLNDPGLSVQSRNLFAGYLMQFRPRGKNPLAFDAGRPLFRYYLGIEPAAPDVFKGVYRYVRVIGAGAEGVVFEVADTRSGRTLALKVLAGGGAGQAETFARALSGYSGVAEIVEYGSAGRFDYIVQELLDGAEMSHRSFLSDLDRLYYSPDERLQVLLRLIEGLSELMDRGILPKDFQFMSKASAGSADIKFFDSGQWMFFGSPQSIRDFGDDDLEVFTASFTRFFAHLLRSSSRDLMVGRSQDSEALRALVLESDRIEAKIKPDAPYDFVPYIRMVRAAAQMTLQNQAAEADFEKAYRSLGMYEQMRLDQFAGRMSDITAVFKNVRLYKSARLRTVLGARLAQAEDFGISDERLRPFLAAVARAKRAVLSQGAKKFVLADDEGRLKTIVLGAQAVTTDRIAPSEPVEAEYVPRLSGEQAVERDAEVFGLLAEIADRWGVDPTNFEFRWEDVASGADAAALPALKKSLIALQKTVRSKGWGVLRIAGFSEPDPIAGAPTTALWNRKHPGWMDERIRASRAHNVHLAFEREGDESLPYMSAILFSGLLSHALQIRDAAERRERLASLTPIFRSLTGSMLSLTDEAEPGFTVYEPAKLSVYPAIQPLTLRGYLDLVVYLQSLSRVSVSESA